MAESIRPTQQRHIMTKSTLTIFCTMITKKIYWASHRLLGWSWAFSKILQGFSPTLHHNHRCLSIQFSSRQCFLKKCLVLLRLRVMVWRANSVVGGRTRAAEFLAYAIYLLLFTIGMARAFSFLRMMSCIHVCGNNLLKFSCLYDVRSMFLHSCVHVRVCGCVCARLRVYVHACVSMCTRVNYMCVCAYVSECMFVCVRMADFACNQKLCNVIVSACIVRV
jgi:hypothetical protein